MSAQISEVLLKNAEGEDISDTLFNFLLHQKLPPEELTLTRLRHEAISIVGAGLETTMRTLTVACFHILNQPETRQQPERRAKTRRGFGVSTSHDL